jgi:IMP dehydrogenase
MAKIVDEISRTFSEFLLIPRLTRTNHIPGNVDLKTPLSRFSRGTLPAAILNTPFVSASMQSVSGVDLAIALAKKGGLAFIYCSQPIDEQAGMIAKVKSHKAGFVQSDSNLRPDNTLAEAVDLQSKTGHSTIPVTHDGTRNGKFLGILTDKDFWEFEDDLNAPVSQYMTEVKNVIYGNAGISLHDANALLHRHKKECLPVLDTNGCLQSLVFKKDYVDHRNNPYEMLDDKGRVAVGAGINTHDYKDRVPELVDAGVDIMCFDSSDGYTEFQKEAALWARKKYGNSVVIGGGNIVDGEAFDYLVREANVDFVKVGIGGGSICITREQKGIGRGQASALMDVVAQRDRYFKETGIYVPVCSDGGLANDTQIIIALAMGADFVMMGRYFAMTNESPTPKVSIGGRIYKPYWGEGSNRARNWQRYAIGNDTGMKFEEGIDAYVPVVGSLSDMLDVTIAKLKSTMCNAGAITLKDFNANALLTRVSQQSFAEGGTSNVMRLDNNMPKYE